MERLTARYLVETSLPVAQAAAALAGEQSSGTFVEVPGETAELKQRFAARVENITELEAVGVPSLPTGRAIAATYRRAEVTVSWSVENFGANLPALVSTTQGNLYELAQFSGLRLLDSLPTGPTWGLTSRRLPLGRPPSRGTRRSSPSSSGAIRNSSWPGTSCSSNGAGCQFSGNWS